MKILGKCHDCEKRQAEIGLNGHQLCMACFRLSVANLKKVADAAKRGEVRCE